MSTMNYKSAIILFKSYTYLVSNFLNFNSIICTPPFLKNITIWVFQSAELLFYIFFLQSRRINSYAQHRIDVIGLTYECL